MQITSGDRLSLRKNGRILPLTLASVAVDYDAGQMSVTFSGAALVQETLVEAIKSGEPIVMVRQGPCPARWKLYPVSLCFIEDRGEMSLRRVSVERIDIKPSSAPPGG